MKQQTPSFQRVWIQVICVTGFILLFFGCTPSPAGTVENTPVGVTEMAASQVSQAAFTLTATTRSIIQTTSTNPVGSETPYVWIDTSTAVPQTGTLPIYPTFTETSTPTITLTTPKGPSPRFTRTPTTTATVTTTSKPPGAPLSISNPGQSSKIMSPYEILSSITRGEDKLVHLSLIGEDQQTFYSEVLDYRLSDYNRLLVSPVLTFTIPSVAENARLILQTYDAQGRVMALTSVDLILLSIGKNEINPARYTYAPFVIDTPDDSDEIQGKRLIVSGRAAAMNKNPVIVELLDEKGQAIVKQELDLDPPLTGEIYTHFVIDMDYAVTRQTQARLVVRQESDNRIPGTIALASVAVTLLP